MAIDPKITATEVAQYLGLTVQAIHKRIKILGLKIAKSKNKIFFGNETARKIINPTIKPLVLSVAVVKGGVGKTTIAENIAVRACLYGLRVLCVDVDQQSNLTKGLSMGEFAKEKPIMIDLVEGKASIEESILNVIPGLDLLPSRLDNVTLDGYMMVQRINLESVFKKILAPIVKNYDLIIFDCPPNLGTSVCASFLTSDLIITLLNPDTYSYDGIEIMDKEIGKIEQQFNKNIQWKILLNKFDSKTVLSTNYISLLIQHPKFSKKLLKSVIRTSQEFPNMKDKEKNIYDNLKKTTGKEDIDALTKEIIQMMSKNGDTSKNLAINKEAEVTE